MSNSQNPTQRVDVQFHFSPEFYTELVKKEGKYITTDRWSVQGALDYMDRCNIGMGIMSVSTPSVNFLPVAESITLARRLNDAAAKVASDNPGRFGNFATLPMLDVAATLAEIAYCYDMLKMEGVCMMSNINGLYPGHSSFEPIFEELNKREAVVFIHPHDPSYMGTLNAPDVGEWPFDTTRAAIDLMYSGTVRKYPAIRFILAHAGGALPMIYGRVRGMSLGYTRNGAQVKNEEISTEVANSFYYDLAISAGENAIGALRGVTTMNNVLFACDWPFAPDMAVDANIKGFEALQLTPEERYAIERGNAVKLFPGVLTTDGNI
jgi:predicted TIM-barrel fold metal-dependent hydrolase